MGSEFNFFQQWYPVLPTEDLDPHRPTPITLLGLRLVIWRSPLDISENYQNCSVTSF